MDNKVCCIWMQKAVGVGHGKTDRILTHFGSVQDFALAGEREWRLSGLFSNREMDRLKNTSFEYAESVINKCAELGHRIIAVGDSQYPLRLTRMTNAPLALYIWGDMPDIDDEVAVAVVGTRSATPYGHKTAFRLSYRLAECGALVVSGAAMGIDSDAHKGALQSRGKTVAVLGCGLDYPYLMENAGLRKTISENGAVISEYSPGTPPSRGSFPVRNRIIAGLSLGTVVVEASIKSGSLLTANHALEQGRDVFAVPGNIMSAAYAGSNRLLRDGAKPVFSAADILCEYTSEYPHRLDMTTAYNIIGEDANASSDLTMGASPKPKVSRGPIQGNKTAQKEYIKSEVLSIDESGLGENARVVISVVKKGPIVVDNLIEKTKLSAGAVLAALTELEISGIIDMLPGNICIIKQK